MSLQMVLALPNYLCEQLLLPIAEVLLPARWVTELRMLYRIVLHPVRGSTHAERLESFYSEQAEGYDEFRQRLLHGREEMIHAATSHVGRGGIWADLGGGTGANLEMAGDEVVMSFAKVYIVDLCPSLLQVARQRCADRGWHHIEFVEADATTWVPDEGKAKLSLVTFSYSLTMIPDWWAAVQQALRLLKPNGTLGVVDFYVSRKYPAAGLQRHSYLQRNLWPFYFAHDNVRLSPDHLPFLLQNLRRERLEERLAPLPYIGRILPGVPHYLFIGSKSATDGDEEEDEDLIELSDPPTK